MENSSDVHIYVGDALTWLKTMPANCFNTCVTSPPYFWQRDYGVEGQIGLEATPKQYIETLVDVFREVHRVLRSDGNVWVVIGDTYAGGGKGRNNKVFGNPAFNEGRPSRALTLTPVRNATPGYKPKDLIGIPSMLALALRDDGWYRRDDIIVVKSNPIPESMSDRCTRSHEHILMMSKSPDYYFDAAAIAEPAVSVGAYRTFGKNNKARQDNGRTMQVGMTRNARNVWTFGGKGTKEGHYATFPVELPEKCIRAGCPPGGKVLDCFAGIGTTGLATIRLGQGRSFAGIELNPKYAEIAQRHFAEPRLTVFEEPESEACIDDLFEA